LHMQDAHRIPGATGHRTRSKHSDLAPKGCSIVATVWLPSLYFESFELSMHTVGRLCTVASRFACIASHRAHVQSSHQLLYLNDAKGEATEG